MTTILLVEDERPIREFLALTLERERFTVLEAESGEQAQQLMEQQSVDLLLLDVELPGMNGYEVMKWAKAKDPNVAIIMVTAQGQDMNVIMGLELGADDYVVKPFNPQQIVARIRAVLRRSQRVAVPSADVLVDEAIKLNSTTHSAYRYDVKLELPPKEFELLAYFMARRGQAIRRDDLLNAIWGDDFFGDTKTVDVHVRRLREKIEDDPSAPRYLQTVWGVGYRWRE